MNIDDFRAALSAAIIQRLTSLDLASMDEAGMLKSGALLRVLDTVDAASSGVSNRAYQYFILGSI